MFDRITKIELEKIQDTIEEATKNGYSVTLIINGEYYEIKTYKEEV